MTGTDFAGGHSCDGSYQSSCDPHRAYTNITQILKSYNANSLLSYMQTYWTSNDGSDESFWVSKHRGVK